MPAWTSCSSSQPDVIFAELVGSCADLVATVVKPLLELRMLEFTPTSLSVFTDGRLLRLRLLDQPMPFSEDVCYIFDKQIEEAGLLVVNKIDLLTSQRFEDLNLMLARRYPAKSILFQNSLAPASAANWLRRLSAEGPGFTPTRSLDIDYQRYGAGEARLAWFDQTLTIDLPAGSDGRMVLQRLIEQFLTAIQAYPAAIGHVKFLARSSGGGSCKLSFTTIAENGWQERIPALPGNQLSLLVNARVEIDAGSIADPLRGCAAAQWVGLPAAEQPVLPPHPAQTHPPAVINKKAGRAIAAHARELRLWRTMLGSFLKIATQFSKNSPKHHISWSAWRRPRTRSAPTAMSLLLCEIASRFHTTT